KNHRAPSCPYVEQEQAGIAVSVGVDDSEPRSESGYHDADCAHLLAPVRRSIPGVNGVFYLHGLRGWEQRRTENWLTAENAKSAKKKDAEELNHGLHGLHGWEQKRTENWWTAPLRP